MLKTIGKVFAILLVVSGLIWSLQGLNLLPGTFMRGDPQWIVNGAITAIIGLAVFWFLNRKSK